VDRLFNHLASPSEGLGKSSGYAHVKSAAPAVQTKYQQKLPHGRGRGGAEFKKEKNRPRGLC
jgi:hypothetical protein